MSAIDLANYVQLRMKALDLTVTSAADLSGISRQTWHKLKRADIKEAKISTLIGVATTLKTSVPDLLGVYFQSSGRSCSHVWGDSRSLDDSRAVL